MSTTKIIKGWVLRHVTQDYIDTGKTVYMNRAKVLDHDEPATLYMGTGKLWTEEEVRAMLHKMRSVAVSQRIGFEQYDAVCKEHGLTL